MDNPEDMDMSNLIPKKLPTDVYKKPPTSKLKMLPLKLALSREKLIELTLEKIFILKTCPANLLKKLKKFSELTALLMEPLAPWWSDSKERAPNLSLSFVSKKILKPKTHIKDSKMPTLSIAEKKSMSIGPRKNLIELPNSENFTPNKPTRPIFSPKDSSPKSPKNNFKPFSLNSEKSFLVPSKAPLNKKIKKRPKTSKWTPNLVS